MDKKEMRTKHIKARKEMSKTLTEDLSIKISRNIESTVEYRDIENICAYMPINNEVDLRKLNVFKEKSSKKLWLPRVNAKDMDFFLYEGEDSVEVATFGILEPKSDICLKDMDDVLIIIPGVVFSRKFERIGYGGGYYDRFLQRFPNVVKMAVGYELQLVEGLPSEKHDKKMDIIITENEILYR